MLRSLGILIELVIHSNIIAILVALAKMITGFSMVSPLYFMCSAVLMFINGFLWSKIELFRHFSKAYLTLSFVNSIMALIIRWYLS